MADGFPLLKPPVRAHAGLVVAKHPLAAAVGAEILASGGNAADAAIATAFAIGVFEPYMSGPGGIAIGLYWDGQAATVFDGATRVPQGLDPAAFPMCEGKDDATMFGWPRVAGDRNVIGATSVTVPTEVAVLAALHSRAGTMPWADLLAPAIRCATGGFPVDWLTTLNLVELRAELQDPAPFATFLPNGAVPSPGLGNARPDNLRQPDLASTLRALAEEGPAALYGGRVGARIAQHVRQLGGYLDLADLEQVAVRTGTPLRVALGEHEALLPDGLNGGPTVARILGLVTESGARSHDPASQWPAFVRAGLAAFSDRLTYEGCANPDWTPEQHPDLDPRAWDGRYPVRPAVKDSTTHIAVVDRDGRGVSLTMTLLSRWGSRVLVPQTGVVMNNGAMWCDPRPGAANPLRPGATPLANMAPALLTRGGELQALVGSSGGRRIICANAQLLHYLALGGLSPHAAVLSPRVDFSAVPVLAPSAIGEEARARLEREAGVPVSFVEQRLGTAPFASPVAIGRAHGAWEGGLDPWGQSAAAGVD